MMLGDNEPTIFEYLLADSSLKDQERGTDVSQHRDVQQH
jgi:hypothetical protein